MTTQLPECNVCHRLHEPGQPCPLRIANAYTMQGGMRALEALTEADKKWMAEHKDFSVLDTVEDAVAGNLEMVDVLTLNE